jgi:hypothetical protein
MEMTEAQAKAWVINHADDDDFDEHELEAAYRAIFGAPSNWHRPVCGTSQPLERSLGDKQNRNPKSERSPKTKVPKQTFSERLRHPKANSINTGRTISS